MAGIATRLGREVLVLDGAFGTMLQRSGAPLERCAEELNVTDPDLVAGILRDYVLAGARCVTTNSFGGTRAKLAAHGLSEQVAELNRASVRVARSAEAEFVLADVGPTGLVLEPLGDAGFEEVFELFAEQIVALAAEEPDAVLVETMTDIAEARCAVLAAKAVCDLPVLASVTFGLTGRTDLSGTDPATAAVVLEAAGADAVGMNCGLGPEQILPLVRRMAEVTALPILVQPNAGLPRLEEGRTVFPGTAEEMGAYATRFVQAGASLVGSCCGSDPEFTRTIAEAVRRLPVATGRTGLAGTAIAGPRGFVRIGAGAPLVIIGERINPTGKPALADSLRAGSMEVVREFAVEQQHAGAHALDVNVGAPGVDASEVLPKAMLALAGLSDLPLAIDTTDPVALEAALRVYPGRALVNSVSGEAASIETVLPLAARYGAAVVVLALDDDGIPETAEGRVAVVRRVREAAHATGLSDSDLIVDTLTLAAATDSNAVSTTLEALRTVSRESGLATVLGVSNVSHGLPGRPALNATFMSMAEEAGLDAAIADPSELGLARSVAAADALLGRDEQCARWVAHATALARTAAEKPAKEPAEEPGREPARRDEPVAPEEPARDRLVASIERGDAERAPELVDALIQGGMAPGAVIADVLTPAIQRLGDAFGRGEVYLPQLMVAAKAMKAAVGQAKTHLPAAEAAADEGTVVFATVKGDIHSIGKDICVSLLESQGFRVHDLGVDVPSERVVSAAVAEKADAVCLSALMTTTLPAMQATVEAVRSSASGVAVFVGGAVVTEKWASTVGAGYADDAPGCVRIVREAVSASAKEASR